MIHPLHREPPDCDWYELVRRGDVGAYEAMFRAHYEPLCRFVLGYDIPREAAEDLVQDVFFRIWEQRARWELQTTLAAYLYGATRNRALDYVRHRLVVRQWEARAARTGGRSLVGTICARTEPADERLELRELDAAIQRAVAQLPERCRQTFLLSRVHGLGYADIAAAMDVSVKTVKVQMGRALKALRVSLAPFTSAALPEEE